MVARIASTAAPSAAFLSPRPTQRLAASAAASVTRTSSRARFRSGITELMGAKRSWCTLARVTATTTPPLDVAALRRRFPALSRSVNGRPAAFLDGPGGSQTPDVVIDAMTAYLRGSNANLGGAFVTSVESDALYDRARQAGADFTGSRPEEIAFGANMTTLNFQLAHAVGADAEGGRRDHRHAARPRRERVAVAADRGRLRADGAHGADPPGRRDARSRRARGAADRPDEGRRVHARVERRRLEARREADRRRRPQRRRAGLGRRRPLRAARSHRPDRARRSTSWSARRTSSSARTSGWRRSGTTWRSAGRPIGCAPPTRRRPATGSRRARCRTRRWPDSWPPSTTWPSSATAPPAASGSTAPSRASGAHEEALSVQALRRLTSTAGVTIYGITDRIASRSAPRRSRSTSTASARARSRPSSARDGVFVWDGNYYALNADARARPRGARRRRAGRVPALHDARRRSTGSATSWRRSRRAPSRAAGHWRCVTIVPPHADVAELVDAHGSGPCARKGVEVQSSHPHLRGPLDRSGLHDRRDGGACVEFGAHLPLISFAGEQRTLDDLLAFTEAARDLGYTHLCANDHLVFARPWLDGPTALAAVVARSGRMTLATTVAVPVLRGPAATAKILAAIDVLSGGRLVVGLGPGSSLGTTRWSACRSRSAGSGWTRPCRRCARTGERTTTRSRARSTPPPGSRSLPRPRSDRARRSGSGAGARRRG